MQHISCISESTASSVPRNNISKGLQPVEYILTEEKGPDHDKQFSVEVRVNGEVYGCGTGHTKKAAEQAAAYQAIQEKKLEAVSVK